MSVYYDVIRVLRCHLLFNGCPEERCEDEEFCLFVINRFHGFFIHRILIEWEYNKRIKKPSFEDRIRGQDR